MKKHIKLKRNPTENPEHRIKELISRNYFPRYKYQLSYLAKFSKYVNGEENIFHKRGKSDFNYNHMNRDHAIHKTLMQELDDEQL